MNSVIPRFPYGFPVNVFGLDEFPACTWQIPIHGSSYPMWLRPLLSVLKDIIARRLDVYCLEWIPRSICYASIASFGISILAKLFTLNALRSEWRNETSCAYVEGRKASTNTSLFVFLDGESWVVLFPKAPSRQTTRHSFAYPASVCRIYRPSSRVNVLKIFSLVRKLKSIF